MEKEIFDKQKQEIITLEEEVKKLKEAKQKVKIIRAKEKELFDLKVKHYNDFYNGDIPDYSLIHEKTPFPYPRYSDKIHYLCEYSYLNVDEIGKLICELYKKYENKTMYSRRIITSEGTKGFFHNGVDEIPHLIIGSKHKVYTNPFDYYGELDEDKLIVINYREDVSEKEFPTQKPVEWVIDHPDNICRKEEITSSNYNKLLNSVGNISFDYKGKAFIEDLIYSLAYHQFKNGITYMSEEETKDVFKRIYKIR